MPLIAKCFDCDEVLYVGKKIIDPHDIIAHYKDRCPKCGRKLSPILENIEVKPYLEEDQKMLKEIRKEMLK